ncbi:hypothetical protein OQA88_7685 [Cercophora sp. LCS_1]
MAEKAPPAYTPTPAAADEAPDVDIAAAFANLTIPPSPTPTVEACLVHLKLLFAFQSLKEDIGYTDGLFGLWDSLAGSLSSGSQNNTNGYPVEKKKIGIEQEDIQAKMGDQQLQILSQIREKRWALFVARAAERYKVWWKSLGGRPLRGQDMVVKGSEGYEKFVEEFGSPKMEWTELVPLDVLMVWHTHMLNPRAYLEDCMLAGLRSLWAGGMPWELANRAIGAGFEYTVSDTSKDAWKKKTGLAWDNIADPDTTAVSCPQCKTELRIPWTTCSVPEGVAVAGLPDLAGTGYGDGNLSRSCPACRTTITKSLLCVAKFTEDVNALLDPTTNKPMPGTLLHFRSGTPVCVPSGKWRADPPHVFPNKLLLKRNDDPKRCVTGLLTPGANPTMQDVREKLEKMVKRNGSAQGDGVYVRKMMARYWDNWSPFALDLCSAVMRQGVFVEKMHNLDWLHSPTARETMERLLTKYERFTEIMSKYPGNVAVPTLDVDLAWHTHQLSPGAYYAYSVAKYPYRFVDHDDKIDEDALSAHFEWTSRVYQEMYGAVYSECTCWYCEAVRTSVINPLGRLLGVSTQEQVAGSFHSSGQAQLHPADNSAHISSHNSVRASPDPNVAKPPRAIVERSLAARHRRRIDEAYAKAQKRAAQKGRKIPPKDQYYTHWGYPYACYVPAS